MSTDATEDQKPEIVPVAAIRLKTNEIPNRDILNKQYRNLGTFKFPEGNIRCFAHLRHGSLLFIMPDRTGYQADTATLGNQCYKYWKQTSLEPQTNPPARQTDVPPVIEPV